MFREMPIRKKKRKKKINQEVLKKNTTVSSVEFGVVPTYRSIHQPKKIKKTILKK
jgi:hypothetical protein